MVPRTVLSFALLLLVATAGCLGGPSPADGTETPPPSDTPTTMTRTPTQTPDTASPSETPVYATDCPPRLHVEAATESQRERADAEDVIAYENLSAERRTEFDRALEGGDAELDSVPEAWSRPRIVTYEGESYATVVSVC